VIITHIPSRYGRGLQTPSAAAVARFGWGFTPLRFVVRDEKPADPDVWRDIPRPPFVSPCQKLWTRIQSFAPPPPSLARKRAARARVPEPWEIRRAEYEARKASA
jgi:hypothetical protein